MAKSNKVSYNPETRILTLEMQLEENPELATSGKSYVFGTTGGFKSAEDLGADPNTLPEKFQVSANVIVLKRDKLATRN